jgi:predicted Zn-dependent protease with MMP-like domain
MVLNIKIKNKMTLKNLTNKNELINKLTNFNLAKKDYKETLPEEIKRKKENLINMIQDIQSDEFYIENATVEEKKEFVDFLNELTS